MHRSFFCALALLIAAPALADTVQLRPRIEASGPAVTFGDVFTGAGAVASRAIAPAPSPGQSSALSAQFLVAAAESAGLDWTPPAGVTQVRVVRPGGARATIAAESGGGGETAVRRGETIELVYVAPGLQLTTRARALNNAGVGEPVRLVNLQSNRTVEAVVTGPGAAAANAR